MEFPLNTAIFSLRQQSFSAQRQPDTHHRREISVMSDQHDVAELLALNLELLSAIDSGNWEVYLRLCDPDLTAFEPEAVGHLVKGMEFHHYYFELEREGPRQSTMSSPHVRMLGDVAVVTYTRLTQSLDIQGNPQTTAAEETRIWQHREGEWRHIHFHRSQN